MAEQIVNQNDLGRFVTADKDLGVGRLISLEDDRVLVRYFRGPIPEPYVDIEHSVGSVQKRLLPKHIRVYLHDGRRWRIGRVDGVHPSQQHTYLVAFPNQQGSIFRDSEFEVRWARPIEDPYAILAASGGDSPMIYEPRMNLLAAWLRQKAASRGVSRLLLGSVELYEHQLHVVRSVASATTPRYLLADEVGLGKTIEAGALIWQYLNSKPEADVLILAPEHLRQQWHDELQLRFRCQAYPQARVRIRTHEHVDRWPDPPVEFLVIDEAHHLTRSGTRAYWSSIQTRLVELAHSADAVLLLSATPVRSNESAFLDLLHLLDPENYRLDNLDSFVQRVAMRDQLALTYQALTSSLSSFDISLYAEELQSAFPNDRLLAALLDEAQQCDDEDRPAAISRLRTHISESYRLHHRLMRTRRAEGIAQDFRLRGRQRGIPFTILIEDETAEIRTRLLDDLRTYLVAGVQDGEIVRVDAVQAFRVFAERCGSLPHALMHHIAAMRDASSTLDPIEPTVVEWLAATGTQWLIDLEAYAPVVLDRVTDAIIERTLAINRGSVVVVSQFTEIAQMVAASLTEKRGAHRVAVHISSNPTAVNTAEVNRWRGDDNCRVLICDATAEEGVNLQTANLILHLDLPWRSFRLEQRVGRVDRHVEEPVDPVGSMVLTYGDSPFSENWFAVIADAVEVFDHSVSALQYVLSDLEDELHWETMLSGAEALDQAYESVQTRLASESQRIAAHDSLDAVQQEEISQLNSHLIELDREPMLSSALLVWLRGVGMRMKRPNHGTISLSHHPRPQVPLELESAMAPWFEEELAVDREAAVKHRLPILRAGHGLVDAIAMHTHRDDRGAAFSLFRPKASQWPAIIFFRTDFLVSIEVPNNLMEIVYSIKS